MIDNSINAQDVYNFLFLKSREKLSTELDGETVILDINSGMYSGLDPVGTTIWNLLEKEVTFSQIVEEILDNYDVSEEQCINDLIDFLNDLEKNGLIVVQGK
ncbi:PqqD family protein [Desulfosediminicola flagellatus]|uniref:PqqD family protein n=1 Tax=Desulfosediminicola flagellatus TaxID=2569541 RepID=UPI0010ABD737|nr:PqqD family protein [Desulfosediminicola flagellatus]